MIYQPWETLVEQFNTNLTFFFLFFLRQRLLYPRGAPTCYVTQDDLELLILLSPLLQGHHAVHTTLGIELGASCMVGRHSTDKTASAAPASLLLKQAFHCDLPSEESPEISCSHGCGISTLLENTIRILLCFLDASTYFYRLTLSFSNQ